MNNDNVTNDSLEVSDFEKPVLPSGLNVLTILTFIGSAIQLIFSLLGFFGARKNYEEKDKAIEQLKSAEIPKWLRSVMPDMEHYEEMVTKSFENRIPILIIGLIATFLCIYGAMQMRKLKKQGYLLYVIGELLPFLSLVLFIGTFALSGTFFMISVFIAILFILLYTLNRKHLLY